MHGAETCRPFVAHWATHFHSTGEAPAGGAASAGEPGPGGRQFSRHSAGMDFGSRFEQASCLGAPQAGVRSRLPTCAAGSLPHPSPVVTWRCQTCRSAAGSSPRRCCTPPATGGAAAASFAPHLSSIPRRSRSWGGSPAEWRCSCATGRPASWWLSSLSSAARGCVRPSGTCPSGGPAA